MRNHAITRNADYYILAHCAKFMQPSSFVLEHRLAHADGLHAAAFRTADGAIAAVVTNERTTPTPLRIGTSTVQLPPRSLTTLTGLQPAIRTP